MLFFELTISTVTFICFDLIISRHHASTFAEVLILLYLLLTITFIWLILKRSNYLTSVVISASHITYQLTWNGFIFVEFLNLTITQDFNKLLEISTI